MNFKEVIFIFGKYFKSILNAYSVFKELMKVKQCTDHIY